MTQDYDSFVEAKSASTEHGGVPQNGPLLSTLFPHQRDLVSWALRKGRACLFADTGLGKSLMELEWARHVSAIGRVLILTPLAVAQQFVREGERFGIPCVYLRSDDGTSPIVVTNYEMLQHFDPRAFIGVVIDESSILKAFDGKTRTLIIDSFQRTPYRLAGTATPAPNDHTELGNHAEFLGIKTRTEMLAEYFVHDGETTQEWRLKGHARDAFWRWVASWSAVIQRPSDLGHDDAGYALLPLRMVEHVIPVDVDDAWRAGQLFADEVRTLSDQRANRRATMEKRVELAARIALESASCGNRNTTTIGASATPTIQSTARKSEHPTPEALNANANICESGPKRTANGSPNIVPSTKSDETRSEGSDTPTTKSTATRSKRKSSPAASAIQTGSDARVSGSSASQSRTTIDDSPSKPAPAPSAGGPTAISSDADFMSTIATEQARSVDCFAPTATQGLANSKTIPNDSCEPLNISSAKRDPCVVWCELNAEQDELAERLGDAAFSIHGSMAHEEKARLHDAWLRGDRPVLISKVSVFGFGMNWQHCSRTVFLGASHSYEQTYQAIRRFWRFGQTRVVEAHVIRAENEGAIMASYRRKEADAARMGSEMRAHLIDAVRAEVQGASRREWNSYSPHAQQIVPDWIRAVSLEAA